MKHLRITKQKLSKSNIIYIYIYTYICMKANTKTEEEVRKKMLPCIFLDITFFYFLDDVKLKTKTNKKPRNECIKMYAYERKTLLILVCC